MLTHKGTAPIQTGRLRLRPFTPEDAQAMYGNWANDARVTRFLTWQPHSSVDASRELLEVWCRSYERPDTYNWAIEYAGAVIGNICVVRLDERSEYADLGYCIGSGYWGRGIMTEAAEAVIRYLFTQIGFHRIGISHAVQNPASGRVAQKCGLTYEGTKRDYFKTSTGEYLDISDYSILSSEWAQKHS